MEATMKGIFVAGGVAVLFFLMMISSCISYGNAETRLRNKINAQVESNKTTFDNVWKIIAQKAQVTDTAKDAFKDIYTNIMDVRYQGGGGDLAKFITEQNPQFDMSLFKDLMNTIEAQRSTFGNEQRKLIAMCNEHNNLLSVFPSSMFLIGRSPIGDDCKIVTSAKTEATFQSGQENDINVFPTKTPPSVAPGAAPGGK
jgi:hypothetical protein